MRCFHCHRPATLCFCDAIPSVDNRTEVVILQHRRERFHPFNTARIVARSLRRCRWLVDHNAALARQFDAMVLEPSVGLLYPGDEAELLVDLAPDQRPRQLVVLDGTWHHTKTLMRDIPRLASLPRYRLAPSSPGRYRIRREPNAEALSTLEATVAALRVNEPGTAGLDELLMAFERMVDRQLDNPKSNWRKNAKRRPGVPNVPRAILHDLRHIVVAYGEQERGGRGDQRVQQAGGEASSAAKPGPLHWVAQRLVSGETFRCTIDSPSLHDADFMQRLELSASEVDGAVSVQTFRERWRAFLRPSDHVAVDHASSKRLLENASADFAPTLILKSISVERPEPVTQDEQPEASESPTHRTRSDRRLARAIAFVRHIAAVSA